MILHNLPLITTLTAALCMSLVLGFLAAKLKLPPLVGYLVAGIIIGPSTPGFVANVSLAGELAEIGIILLMFGVGLHFSIDSLLSVRKIALPGALLQIAVATALGATVAIAWGWSLGGALVFGLALSVASTVVLLKALQNQGVLNTTNGHIAVGWLVIEDLAMIIVLVLLPSLAHWLRDTPVSGAHENVWLVVSIATLKASAFIALILLVGNRFFPKVLWMIARTGSRELFTLCVIATAVGVAYIAAHVFGMSFALGAFFAGMMMRNSKLSHRAAKDSLPLQEAFAVLFFVSVGMLFDPHVLIHEPLKVLAVVSIIIIGKSIAAFALVIAFRYPLTTALTVSASLAQIGEFSFILGVLGMQLGLLPAEGQSLILAGALVSIALNPLVFMAIVPIQTWIRSRSTLAQILEKPFDPLSELPTTTEEKYLSEQVVLVGYRRAGKHIGEIFLEQKIPFVVVEQDRELTEHLRSQGIAAVFGNTSDPAVLIQAHIVRASMLIITAFDDFSLQQMINTARTLNHGIEIIVCARNEEEALLLKQEKVEKIFLSEHELAKSMSDYALERYGKTF